MVKQTKNKFFFIPFKKLKKMDSIVSFIRIRLQILSKSILTNKTLHYYAKIK